MIRPTRRAWWVLVLLLATPVAAQEAPAWWSTWRGPAGTGSASSGKPPVTWSETENIRWKVRLPGLGSSSPVVWGDRLYVTTAVETDRDGPPHDRKPSSNARLRRVMRDPPTKLYEFYVMAVDRSDGSIAWRTKVREALPHEGGHGTSTFASASPITDGERIYAFFGSRGLHVLDMKGKILWSKDLGRMTTMRTFGEGASPALHGDSLVVVWDHEGDSFIAVFDKKTGEERWRKARAEGSTWATPLVVDVDGTPQIIVPGVVASVGYDLASGDEIWRLKGMTRAIIPTPVELDGTVFLMSAFMGSSIQAVRLANARGDLDDTEHVVWGKKRNAPYVSSPLLHAGRLYYVRENSGVMTSADPKTGEPYYEGKKLGLRTIYASPIGVDDHVYFTSREGVTKVVKAGDEFRIVATNELDDVFDATIAVAGDELYLRGWKSLYCIAEGKKK